MMCLVKDGKAYEGSTHEEIARQAMNYSIDYETRTVTLGDKTKDTISYSKSFKDHELEREVAVRVVSLLVMEGWRLYKSHP